MPWWDVNDQTLKRVVDRLRQTPWKEGDKAWAHDQLKSLKKLHKQDAKRLVESTSGIGETGPKFMLESLREKHGAVIAKACEEYLLECPKDRLPASKIPSDWEGVPAVLFSLGDVGVDGMMRVLQHAPHKGVRAAVGEILGGRRNRWQLEYTYSDDVLVKRIIPALLAALRKDPSAIVRNEILILLQYGPVSEKVDPEQAADILLAAFEKDRNSGLRAYAAELMRRRHNARMIAALIRAFQDRKERDFLRLVCRETLLMLAPSYPSEMKRIEELAEKEWIPLEHETDGMSDEERIMESAMMDRHGYGMRALSTRENVEISMDAALHTEDED